MSSRALRRLREEKLQEALSLAYAKRTATIDDKDHDDDDLPENSEEEDSQSSDSSSIYESGANSSSRKTKQSAFSSLLMMDDSDSDDDSDESQVEDSDCSGEGVDAAGEDSIESNEEMKYETEEIKQASLQSIKRMKKKGKSNPKVNINDQAKGGDEDREQQEEEEDLDAILSEFQANDIQNQKENIQAKDCGGIELNNGKGSLKNLLLDGIDVREYDLEHSLRSMLGGIGGGGEQVNNVVRVAGGGGGASGRRAITMQKRCLFAQGREEWGKRPCSYIGGGLGMDVVTFDSKKKQKNKEDEDESDESDGEMSNSPISQPWPYNNYQQILPPSQKYIQQLSTWHKFQRSTTYSSKLEEFETYVERTGDINTLAMFLIDHPFIVEPMLQLAMFFFHTRENEKGSELIKRILWILECACTTGFLPSATSSSRQSASNDEMSTKLVLMDHELVENEVFFKTLRLFVKNSSMVGCVNTSLAASRLLLSLDPLRDPMGILMIMDYFALASLKEANYNFIIDMVESEMINVYHRITNRNGEDEFFTCDLIKMPNWSFSYALALYRLRYSSSFEDEEEEEMIRSKATEALKSAIELYPTIPKLLLEKNKLNITGRSFQTDWPAVLSPLGEINEEVKNFEAIKAESFAREFERAKQKIIQVFIERSYKLWCGDDIVKWLYECCAEVISKRNEANSFDESKLVPIALARYSKCDPSDFEDSFPNIPAANALDPMLVDFAMHVRPNARRMLRMPNRRIGEMVGNFHDVEQRPMYQMRTMLGTGRDGMEVIDPDLPIAEVLWRSLMPWARVDGVPPGTQQD